MRLTDLFLCDYYACEVRRHLTTLTHVSRRHPKICKTLVRICGNLSAVFERHLSAVFERHASSFANIFACCLLPSCPQHEESYFAHIKGFSIHCNSINMLGPIGNDILDIGSRKAAMARAASNAADPLGLGRPGQFEVPNVTDVRYHNNITRGICGKRSFAFASNFSHRSLFSPAFPNLFEHNNHSLPRMSAPTFVRPAATPMPIRKSSLPRVPLR